MFEVSSVTCAQNETFATLATLLSLQPRVSGGGGMSRDDQLTELCTDILKRIPASINFEQVTRKYPVLYEQSMNTVLQQEVIRYECTHSAATLNFRNMSERFANLCSPGTTRCCP